MNEAHLEDVLAVEEVGELLAEVAEEQERLGRGRRHLNDGVLCLADLHALTGNLSTHLRLTSPTSTRRSLSSKYLFMRSKSND